MFPTNRARVKKGREKETPRTDCNASRKRVQGRTRQRFPNKEGREQQEEQHLEGEGTRTLGGKATKGTKERGARHHGDQPGWPSQQEE